MINSHLAYILRKGYIPGANISWVCHALRKNAKQAVCLGAPVNSPSCSLLPTCFSFKSTLLPQASPLDPAVLIILRSSLVTTNSTAPFHLLNNTAVKNDLMNLFPCLLSLPAKESPLYDSRVTSVFPPVVSSGTRISRCLIKEST